MYAISTITNARQRGFSLVEVIITIAIIGILTAGLMTALSSGNDSKVTALFAKAQDIVKAVSLYDAKTGCVPSQLSVLFNKSLATAANNFCGQDTTALYGSEDYISALPLSAAGTAVSGLDLTKTGFANAYIWIGNNSTVSPNYYALIISGLALADQQSLMSKCNGVDYTNGVAMPTSLTAANLPCATGANSGVTLPGSTASSDVVMLINKY